MKNLRTLLTSFIALLCTLTISAHDFEVDGFYYNITSSSKLTVAVTYKGSSITSAAYFGSVVIPEKVPIGNKEYFVTSIGNYAFRDCIGLTSVTIGNSVTSIGYGAFYKCSGLSSVTIPNSVTSIEGSAFEGCKGLSSVTIPNSVTSIGNETFYGCSGLKSVTIGKSVTKIERNAFSDCTGELTVNCNIPSASPSYCGAFYGSKFTSLTISDNVTEIGNYAFYGCSDLTSATIGNSVTSIGDDAFYGCSSLTNVTIGNSVTSIGSSAFSGCSGLMSVDIPNSVTSIGSSAFYGCSGLTSVTISNSVTNIESYTFYNCSKLTDITIPNSVLNIEAMAFDGCSMLRNLKIEDGENPIRLQCNHLAYSGGEGSGLFSNCRIVSLYLGRDIDYYTNYNAGYSPFYNQKDLRHLTISKYVTKIKSHTFHGCSSLESVNIPNSVTSIGNDAFRDCSGLTSMTIPNSVTTIRDYAFYGCTGELAVNCNIPSASSSNYGAFYGSKFTSVIIGDSVTSIGEYAFYNCSAIKSMHIEDGETLLTYSDNFLNTLDSLYLGRNLTSKSSYFNTGENNLSVLSIGKQVISLDDKMFYNCSNISKVISYATEPPMAYPLTFYTDIYGKATLSVLGESMEKYRNADVWKKFYKIEEIDNNPDATEQCAAPVITYADGKLQFTCETAGAECKYTLTAKDIQTVFITANNNSVDLTACYDITAYAVAEGYKNSEKVTATLYWIDGSDVSTNINQTEMRGVMATYSGGIITVSGLADGETVMFYNANGALLYTGTAQNGTISYAPSASGVIIVKIGKTSIKVVR